MKPNSVRLFVKSGCPWCDDAVEWLDARGIPFQTLNVFAHPKAYKEMRELSGQERAPVLDVDGQILADFDAGQLAQFWKRFE